MFLPGNFLLMCTKMFLSKRGEKRVTTVGMIAHDTVNGFISAADFSLSSVFHFIFISATASFLYCYTGTTPASISSQQRSLN